MPLDDPYTYEPKEYANPGMPDGKVPPKPPMHPTAQNGKMYIITSSMI